MSALSRYLFSAILEYLDFVRVNTSRARSISNIQLNQLSQKLLNQLLLGFERFSAGSAALSFASLVALEYLSHKSYHLNGTLAIVGIFIFSYFLFFFLAKRTRHFSILSSVFHIVALLLIFYYPAIKGIDIPGRTLSNSYLLYLITVLLQSLRPGKMTGLPVIFLVILHYSVYSLFKENFSIDYLLHLIFLLWTSVLALFIESVILFHLLGYVDLRSKQHHEREDLGLAQKVYQHLFPSFHENEHIRLYSTHIANHLIGGDFYDIIHMREGNLGFFMADISGHGISSAMMSAAMKGIITGMSYKKKQKPSDFLTELDRILASEYESHHATAIYIYFDFNNSIIHLANAGHPHLLHGKKNSRYNEIRSEGSLIGYRLRSPIADDRQLKYSSGDRFILYTDGLVEYNSVRDEVKTIDNILDIANCHVKSPIEEVPQKMIRQIKSLPDFKDFRDDVMLVMIEIK